MLRYEGAGAAWAMKVALACVCSISDVFLLVTKSTILCLGGRKALSLMLYA